MGYLKLNRLILISAIIPLVCGICKQDTKEKFYESLPELSNIPDDTLTVGDTFAVQLDLSSCADDVRANEKNKYAFLKYVAWSKKAALDKNRPHYGCTCKQVIALFNFAENTEPHHIMCRYEDIFKAFCDGFPRYDKFDEKSASVITNLKTFDSEFLDFLFHSAADLVKQYIMKNREVSDAEWPIVKTLNGIKGYKETYENRHKQIMEKKPATDTEGPNSPTVPAYMIAQMTARSMELNFSPDIVAEIVNSPYFNSIGFAIKVMALENVLLVPNIKNYVTSVVNKFPSLLNLMVTVLLPTGVSPYTPASDMQAQVREFVRQFFEKAAEKQNGWKVELTQKALSFYCKMALRDLKDIYAKMKLEAEAAAAAKVKAAQDAAKANLEGEGRATEEGGGKSAEEQQQGQTAGGEKTTVAHQQEQKDADGKTTGADDQEHQEGKATTHTKQEDSDDFEDKKHQTSPTPEQIKLAAILESFSSFADNAALDKYIEANKEHTEERYTIVPDAIFIEDVPLTCTYT